MNPRAVRTRLGVRSIAVIATLSLIAGVIGTFGAGVVSASSSPAEAQTRAGFYFLEPLVASPSFSGVFDPSQSPVVEVCTAIGDGCALPVHVKFTTAGRGSARVRVDVAKELYGVNLPTATVGLSRGTPYVLRVRIGQTELGRLQFVLVDRPDSAPRGSQDPLQLRYGTTVPVAFRVEQGAVPASGPLAIHTAEQAGVSDVIGAGGGSLTTSFHGVTSTLTIPPGALVDDVDITMTPIDGADNFPLSGGLAAGVQFGPEGLSLYQPATLRFDLPSGTGLGGLIGFKYAGSGADFHLVTVDEGGTSVTLQVTHFSGAGVGAGTFADVDAVLQQLLLEYTNRNNAPDLVYPTMMVHGAFILAESVCGGTDPLGSCDTEAEQEMYRERVIALHLELLDIWYKEGVKPRLEVNALATENGLRHAAKQFMAWIGVATLSFDSNLVAPLDAHRDEGRLLLATALKNAITNDAAACRDEEAIDWFGLAETLVLTGVGGLPATIDGIAELATCTVIDVTGAPAQLDHGASATLTVRVGRREQGQTTFLAWNERVRLTVEGCGFLDNGPWFEGTVSGATMSFEVELDADTDESCTAVTVSMGTGHTTRSGPHVMLGAVHKLIIPISAASIIVTPEEAILQPSGTAQFSATVTGLDNTDVVWSATGGTITATGLYTAGSVPGTYMVTAETTSGVPTQSATATVVILPVSSGRVIVGDRQSRVEAQGTAAAGLVREDMYEHNFDVSTASSSISARVSRTIDDGANSAVSSSDTRQSVNLVYNTDGSLRLLEGNLELATLASRNSVTQTASAEAAGWARFEIGFTVVGGTVAWQMSGLTELFRTTSTRDAQMMTMFHFWNRTTREDIVLVEAVRDGQVGQREQEFSAPLTGAMTLTPGEYYLVVEVGAGSHTSLIGFANATGNSTFTMTFTPQ